MFWAAISVVYVALGVRDVIGCQLAAVTSRVAAGWVGELTREVWGRGVLPGARWGSRDGRQGGGCSGRPNVRCSAKAVEGRECLRGLPALPRLANKPATAQVEGMRLRTLSYRRPPSHPQRGNFATRPDVARRRSPIARSKKGSFLEASTTETPSARPLPSSSSKPVPSPPIALRRCKVSRRVECQKNSSRHRKVYMCLMGESRCTGF